MLSNIVSGALLSLICAFIFRIFVLVMVILSCNRLSSFLSCWKSLSFSVLLLDSFFNKYSTKSRYLTKHLTYNSSTCFEYSSNSDKFWSRFESVKKWSEFSTNELISAWNEFLSADNGITLSGLKKQEIYNNNEKYVVQIRWHRMICFFIKMQAYTNRQSSNENDNE